MRTEFKNPDGSITKSYEAYAENWTRLGKFIEEISNGEFYLAAFDPSLQFNSKTNSWPLSLPPSFVIRLKSKFDELEKKAHS